MTDVNLTFEVHCERPRWAIDNINNTIQNYSDSRYRIYVDDDLMVERTWIWGNNVFLQENIWINVNKNSTHTLLLEPIVLIQQQAKFNIKNLQILNNQSNINEFTDLQVNFSI